jgi:transposase-like protein
MAERGLSVDHTTVWRWTQTYAPEVQRRLRGQAKPKGSTWHMDEIFVRIAGRWMYLLQHRPSSVWPERAATFAPFPYRNG